MTCYKSLFFFIIIAIGFSCTRDLDVPFPEHQPRLTLNTFFVEGGTPFLHVSRSFSALETVTDSSILVKDATVELWKEGVKLSNFGYRDTVHIDTFGQYEVAPGIFDYFVEVNRRGIYLPDQELSSLEALKTYEFRASHPSFGEARAAVTLVPKPEILSIQMVKDSIVTRDFDDGYQDKWTALKIQLKDPGEVANYYNFTASVKYTDDGFQEQQVADTLFWYTADLVATDIIREADGVVYSENKPISDEAFDGQEQTIVVYIRLPGCCGYAEDLAREGDFTYYSIGLQAFMLDANYGVFQEKRELQRFNRTEGLEGALIPTEPVVVPGNVEGGYGLVGSFNSIVRSVDIP